MAIKDLIIYFLTGGIVTTLIVALEQSGFRLISGIAAIVPIFTLVAYIFIGNTSGSAAVAQHALFVLVGTFVAWVPYMLAIIWMAPRIGTNKAIVLGLIIFAILSIIFVYLVSKYHLFNY